MNMNKEKEIDKEIFQVFQELRNRYLLASKLGISYSGKRDLYDVLGYKRVLDVRDFLAKYERQDIAKAIVDKIAKVTWQGDIVLFEGKEIENTPLELAWENLYNKFSLKNVFVRADKLAMICGFSVIYLGLDDVENIKDLENEVIPGRKLLYVKVFGAQDISITEYINDASNEEYGNPLYYEISFVNIDGKEQTCKVHKDRIIHIAHDSFYNEVFGISIYQSIFNRLEDLEKLVGGSAEMFWRGARPGFSGKISDDYIIDNDTAKKLENEIIEYEHDLRRLLLLKGIELESLQTQIVDPSSHIDCQLRMISAATGIPLRILIGSERGELASTQDRQEWLEYINARRLEYAEPLIVRKFVDTCIKYEILPEPLTDYSVQWSDLFALSEEDRAKIGEIRAKALSTYASQPEALSIVPPEAFMELFLGLNNSQIGLIHKYYEQQMKQDLIEEDND